MKYEWTNYLRGDAESLAEVDFDIKVAKAKLQRLHEKRDAIRRRCVDRARYALSKPSLILEGM